MKAINLIPKAVQQRLRQHRRLHAWAIGLGGFAACLALAGTAVRLGYINGKDNISAQIEAEQAKMKVVKGEYLRDKASMTSLRKAIDSANAMGRHPNWGVLLDMVSQALNDQTVLDGVELTKTKIEPPKPTAVKGDAAAKAVPIVPRTDFTIALRGRSQSVEAMGHMLVELEKCQIFSKVTLGDNRRVEAESGSMIEFEVTCLLDSSESPTTIGEKK